MRPMLERRLTRVLLGSIALTLVLLAVRQADLGHALSLLEGAPTLWLALLVHPSGQLFDAWALARLLRAAGIEVTAGEALRLRLVSDALATSLPSGQVVADAAVVGLLADRGPRSSALAALVSRRLTLGLAHGLVLVAAAIVGAGALRQASGRLLGIAGLEWIVAGTGLTLVVGLGLAVAGLQHAGPALALGRVASRIPLRDLHRRLEARQPGLNELDRQIAQCLGGPVRRGVGILGCLVVVMLIESIETFFILGCLHSGLSFAAVLSFESFLSLARAVVFVLPAGLGVQDIGYVAFLDAVGVPGAASVGAAFVVAKRAKEAFWIAMGWSWLCLSRGRPSVIASAASPS